MLLLLEKIQFSAGRHGNGKWRRTSKVDKTKKNAASVDGERFCAASTRHTLTHRSGACTSVLLSLPELGWLVFAVVFFLVVARLTSSIYTVFAATKETNQPSCHAALIDRDRSITMNGDGGQSYEDLLASSLQRLDLDEEVFLWATWLEFWRVEARIVVRMSTSSLCRRFYRMRSSARSQWVVQKECVCRCPWRY